MKYTYYVEILPASNQRAPRELGIAEFDEGVDECPEKKCLDRSGKEKVADLYRVPKKLFDMVRERDSAGYLFALYIAKNEAVGDLPREQYRNGSSRPSSDDNPFRYRRPRRRRGAYVAGLTRVFTSIR